VTLKNEDLLLNFTEAVTKEIDNIDKTMLPLLQEYVKSVRACRMNLSTEVAHMVSSTQQFKEIIKLTPQLVAFLEVIERLQKALTPEMMVILARLTNGANDEKANT
jgi:hypothetical protein